MGNGAEIKIWDDPWVPRPENFKLQAGDDTDSRLSKVQYMILDNSRLIEAIPVVQGNIQDWVYWAHESKGMYTVKSVYRVIWKEKVESTLNEHVEDNHLYNSLCQYKGV